jgi:hypothetical protein
VSATQITWISRINGNATRAAAGNRGGNILKLGAKNVSTTTKEFALPLAVAAIVLLGIAGLLAVKSAYYVPEPSLPPTETAATNKPAVALSTGPVRSAAAAEREFAAGDVVEIDKDGFECYAERTSLDDLIQMITTDRTAWPRRLFVDCHDLDHGKPYEIMKVSDGAGDYKHVYCVNEVVDFPSNKTGCTWAVFPLGRAHHSSCKPGPSIAAGTPIGRGEKYLDVTPRVPVLLPCQGHELD